MNSVAADLDLNSGRISKRILQAAGPEIEQEIKSKNLNRLKEGEFVETTSGNLQSGGILMILHAFCGQWSQTSPKLCLKVIAR